MSENYILIKESDLDSQIEELDRLKQQSKAKDDLATFELTLDRIDELQSLKQKGEVVEISEITNDDLTHNSLKFLKSMDYKLIKKV